MAKKINLDALIPREDFEITASGNLASMKNTLSIEDLKHDSFFFSSVRKPDFQRETNEWEGKKIANLIESFLDGELIPALILWRSPSGLVFIIDGSHRLSSLCAWINDDYGDGPISKKFYDGIIQEEQLREAEQARILIRKTVGSYEDFRLALSRPEKVSANVIKRAKNLSALAIQLQWVEGDAAKAEKSFFKINQQAAPINPTELALLESRRKPNCIAARAIIRSGKGHKYWSGFQDEKQVEIQKLAKEINDMLFAPSLHTPIKTLDIPIGGNAYSVQALPLILDFVNITNGVTGDNIAEDEDGTETINCLLKARQVAQRLNSSHASSLGLHPIVYFYSQDGRHKVASFYAMIDFVIKMESVGGFKKFIFVRPRFESFLLKYDYLVQQIVRKYRSALSGYSQIADFYIQVVQLMHEDVAATDEEIAERIVKTEIYKYLSLLNEDKLSVTSEDFNKERKSAVYIKEAIATAPRCQICKGLIHSKSVTIDHVMRKQDGGVGSIENGQIAHPYCNTTYKN